MRLLRITAAAIMTMMTIMATAIRYNSVGDISPGGVGAEGDGLEGDVLGGDDCEVDATGDGEGAVLPTLMWVIADEGQ